MPPLLTPSPVIIDQSFPRTDDQLRTVSAALGNLVKAVDEDLAHLLLTDTLRQFVDGFNWDQPPGVQGLLREIHLLLTQWFLQPHEKIRVVDTSDVAEYVPHPVPTDCTSEGLIVFWSDEMGRMLVLHDLRAKHGEFFLGVACAIGFAGGPVAGYQAQQGARCFPMVDPEGVNNLADAYEWEIPEGFQSRPVGFAEALKNCRSIGAIKVEEPRRDSHYKIRFAGARPWLLDRNIDPVPERYISELQTITGLAKPVIEFALIHGKLPNRKCRLD